MDSPAESYSTASTASSVDSDAVELSESLHEAIATNPPLFSSPGFSAPRGGRRGVYPQQQSMPALTPPPGFSLAQPMAPAELLPYTVVAESGLAPPQEEGAREDGEGEGRRQRVEAALVVLLGFVAVFVAAFLLSCVLCVWARLK